MRDSSQPFDPRTMNAIYHLGCFDEYDYEGNRERHAAMDELLKHGYRWNGPPYVRWDMEKGKSRACNLYMPKAARRQGDGAPGRRMKAGGKPYPKPNAWQMKSTF